MLVRCLQHRSAARAHEWDIEYLRGNLGIAAKKLVFVATFNQEHLIRMFFLDFNHLVLEGRELRTARVAQCARLQHSAGLHRASVCSRGHFVLLEKPHLFDKHLVPILVHLHFHIPILLLALPARA